MTKRGSRRFGLGELLGCLVIAGFIVFGLEVGAGAIKARTDGWEPWALLTVAAIFYLQVASIVSPFVLYIIHRLNR